MVFNATFNNISVILWQSVLLVEETGVPGENHRPVRNHWQTLSHNVVSSTPRLNYHMIMTTTTATLINIDKSFIGLITHAIQYGSTTEGSESLHCNKIVLGYIYDNMSWLLWGIVWIDFWQTLITLQWHQYLVYRL